MTSRKKHLKAIRVLAVQATKAKAARPPTPPPEIRTPVVTRHEVQLAADERQANGLPQLPTPQLQEQVRLEKKQIELDIAVARAKEEKALRKREENRKRSLEAKRNSHKPCRRGRLTITSTKEGFRELVAGYRGTTATPPDYFTDLSEAHQALVVRAASDFFIPGGDFTFLKDMVLSLPADERKRFFKEALLENEAAAVSILSDDAFIGKMFN